jgi:hypothetical protein
MKSPRLYLTVFLCCFLGSIVWSQSKSLWVMPKQQLNFQFGQSQMSDYVVNNHALATMPALGLAYTYNFSPHWYTQLNWELIQKRFIMGESVYSGTGTQYNRMVASKDTPFTLLLVRLKLKENQNAATSSDIRNANMVNLTSPYGIYRRNQFSLNFGYMQVLPRNILRLGVGISYFQVQSRDIQTGVFDKTGDNSYLFSSNIPHLFIKDIQNWGFNMQLGYDFFLTQEWSLGLSLSTVSDAAFNTHTLQYGLTIGYAPHKSYDKKAKKKPKA